MATPSIPSIPEIRGVPETRTVERVRTPAWGAYQILHWGFVALPVIAGLDKFTHLLTNWDNYLSPTFARLSPLSAHSTMMAVGVVELAAALIVAVKPKVGGLVVALWLAGIIVNLVLAGGFFDIALRDFGLLLAGVALSRLATAEERGELGGRTVVERIGR